MIAWSGCLPGNPSLENTGFFIPGPVIEHFLKDIADDKYDGFPRPACA